MNQEYGTVGEWKVWLHCKWIESMVRIGESEVWYNRWIEGMTVGESIATLNFYHFISRIWLGKFRQIAMFQFDEKKISRFLTLKNSAKSLFPSDEFAVDFCPKLRKVPWWQKMIASLINKRCNTISHIQKYLNNGGDYSSIGTATTWKKRTTQTRITIEKIQLRITGISGTVCSRAGQQGN